MDEAVDQRCGSCKESKAPADFAPSHRGTPGTWCRECFRLYFRGERVVVAHESRACQWCSATFTPKQCGGRAVYCSRKCKERARNAAVQAAVNASKPARTCKGCGSDIPQQMRSDAKYCSDQCNYQANGAARYAKTRGAEADERFTLDEIYARDLGICYLCHEACARPDASMDHVIPVSPPHHGSHTRANVKLAHQGCNSRKHNRLLSELPWYRPQP